MKTMIKYKELEAWKKSMSLVKEIYGATKKFPKEEIYGLTSQIKRAAVSAPANIAEGYGRNHSKETIQFLHITRGSLYELDTLLEIASEVDILEKNVYQSFNLRTEECIRINNGLINYLERRSSL